jgi:hypothetical protein
MFVVTRLGATMVDAEWDYRDAKLNWQRAVSFIPFNATVWVRADTRGNVTITYKS